MGFYFRKSKSLGPFRLNLSKSGIGISAGVKGARLSMGPNGTYINVGRNGIYYRKKIGSSSVKKNRTSTKQSYSLPSNYENIGAFTDAIRVSPSVGNTSELSKRIISSIKRARICRWCGIVLFITFLSPTLYQLLIPLLLVRLVFSKLFNAVIKYDLDSSASLEWDKYSEIIRLLKSSKKLWMIETAKLNSNAKYNAGAARDVSRSKATVKKIKPMHRTGFKVKTDAPSILVKSRKCSLLFLPSDVIVKKGAKYVAYSYDQLSVYASTTSFIENDHVPRDAEIIRYTWQYVNKDGSADKRFYKNRQIPVCKYGRIHFVVGQELSIELHTSNKLVAENMGNAHDLYKSYINAIGLMPSTAAKEYAPQKSSQNYEDPIRDEKYGQAAAKSAADASLFNDGKIEADGMGEDIYSDLFEPEIAYDDSNNDNSLIDDMAMFLDEGKDENV